MSLPDRQEGPDAKSRRRALLTVAAAAALALSACTVRPLYMKQTNAAGIEVGTSARLAQIGIQPVTTRYAQQVRNDLIFLFGRGAGEPKNPRYTLQLGVTSVKESLANVSVQDINVPTSEMLTLTATYVLTDTTTHAVVSKGKRTMTASFDVPSQEFAAIRAERDAQDRAARELAELLNLAIASDLAKHTET